MMPTDTNAERLVIPEDPHISGALREAVSDFYYNSWRLVPANVVWGALSLVIGIATAVWLPAILLVTVLAIPVAGLHHMSARVSRGQPAGFGDFLSGMRRYGGQAFLIGGAAVLLTFVFTYNVFFGLDVGGIGGWSLSVLALYGDIGLGMFLVAAWPILVDPIRADDAMRSRLRLAALLNVARPGRMFALTTLIFLTLIVSTILFAALLTVSVAFTSLFATRYVLPAADRLEKRATKPVEEAPETA